MRVWIITVGEPLPTDRNQPRLYRAGIISNMLAETGHQVVWWTSNVDHVAKRKRFDQETQLRVRDNLDIILLDGVLYRRNISLLRILNHRQVAGAFRRRSREEDRPDVILCSLPTTELAVAAADYGREHHVPTLIDVRDLWPDVLVDVAPPNLRWLSELILFPMRREVRLACTGATGIVGLTEQYRDWGLRHAGRPLGPNDGVYPLAYDPQHPSESEIADALRFWKSKSIGVGPDEFVVAFFGMMGHHFEAAPVLDAIQSLNARQLPIKFVICGRGSFLESFEQVAARVDNLIVPGWINGAQIWTLMRNAKLGLAPYVDSDNYRKNITNKVIEYLSGGLPIVTNMAGAVEDLLRRHDCGYIYPYDSAEGLERAILDAYSNQDNLRRKAANAIRLFTDEFSTDLVYGQLVRELERLASSSTGG